jgi:acyl-CoA thioesterase FadM
VRLSLSKIGTTSIHWQFEIVKSDTTLAAEGEMVSVKVDSTGTHTAITDSERAKLSAKF